MANKLTQVSEPYVKVHESIVSNTVTSTSGTDLVIGCVIISDTGEGNPTLITSQKEYLANYASQDLNKTYINSLNSLYSGDDSTMAASMWLNAYRLAGSSNLLVVRATKDKGVQFAKSFSSSSSTYILKDGQLLKKVPSFRLIVDADTTNYTSGETLISSNVADASSHGFAINIKGTGIVGDFYSENTSDPTVDIRVSSLEELVEDYMSNSSNFFSPKYTYETWNPNDGTVVSSTTNVNSVLFSEVYLGQSFLDKSNSGMSTGLLYALTVAEDLTGGAKSIDLNGVDYSGFDANSISAYAINKYNSNVDGIKVRIRRFNHDAINSKSVTPDANANGSSPYTVLTNVLSTYFSGTSTVSSNASRDFYEVALYDPSLSSEALYFNLGSLTGRGDIDTLSDLNDQLGLIELVLPDDLSELGLQYYGFTGSKWSSVGSTTTKTVGGSYATYSELIAATGLDTSKAYLIGHTDASYKVFGGSSASANRTWMTATLVSSWDPTQYTTDADKAKAYYTSDTTNGLKFYYWNFDNSTWENVTTVSYNADSVTDLNIINSPSVGSVAKIGSTVAGVYYEYTAAVNETNELFVNLEIDPTVYSFLTVTDSDIKKAFDLIQEDEVYTVEGLCDLGCTSQTVKNYMASMSVSEDGNYFYPISTVDSSNYLTTANSMNYITQDSSKLYSSSPWDIDTGTVGWKFHAAPSVLYWESVCRNKSLSREFAPTFGQTNGVALYQKPVTEYNKKTRQLLLSAHINTPIWNTTTSAYNWNDNYTLQSEDNIMSDEANCRLGIRISKSIPKLLEPLKGRRIGQTLWEDATNILNYWFNNTILPMTYSIDAYKVTINETNNPVEIQRKNKMQVLVEVRYPRALKYTEVYNKAYDVGQDFTGQI